MNLQARQKQNTKKRQPLPESFVEIIVLPDRMMLFLRRGKDITEQLEEQMRHYGLKCSIEFKSPCG